MPSKFIKFWNGEQPLFKQHLQMIRYLTHRHVVGNVPDRSIIFSQKGYIEKYFDEESIEKIKEDGEKLLDKKEGLKLIRGTKHAIKHYWKTVKNKEYDKLEPALLDIFAYFLTSTELVTFHVEKRIKDILEEYYGKDFGSFFLILTTPTIPDLLFKEKKSWAEICEDPSDEKIKKHIERFPYLLANVEDIDEGIETLRKRGSNKKNIMKELEESRERCKKLKRMQKLICKDVDKNELFYISNLIKAISILRLELKNAWSGLHFYLLHICSDRDKMMFCTIKEIFEGISDDEIKNRKKAYMYFFENGKIEFYTDREAVEMKSRLIEENEYGGAVKGVVANRGHAKGRVILVKTDDIREIVKIAKNASKSNILVAGMTNPNMTMLIEKVSAIVTDEGGIACHASIISREMNIPCIIGTRYATKAFKDGDLIEVDAENGVVRKV